MTSPGQGPGETRPLGAPGDSEVLRFAALRTDAVWAGRYEIRELLGSGGGGEVFRAFDRLAHSEVALKVLYPRGGGAAGSMERLRRELRLVRSLNHPGIVRVHDIGESEGLSFLVLDLLRGETLKARLAHGPLPPGEAADVLAQALEALGAAHGAGIVHRDVKPSNIFLAAPVPPSGAAPRVVLLDFGIARTNEGAQFTATGEFLGTPEYAAPEQVRGDPGVGFPADLYSLGVVAWEMLAGSPPFVADSTFEVLRAHAERPLPALRTSLRGAPGWLRDLVAWLLEKEPSRRPPDAASALAFLARRRRRPLWRRVRLTPGRGSLVALAALAAGAALFLPFRVDIGVDFKPAVRSLAGICVHRPDPGCRVMASLPLDPEALWPRRHLLGFSQDGKLPLSLVEFELPFCRMRRFALHSSLQTASPLELAFSRFSGQYFCNDLVRLPWKTERGEPLFAATFRHHNYPSAALVFDGGGGVQSVAAHPGHLEDPIPVEGGEGSGAGPAVVFGGVNRDLDERHVLIALPVTTTVRFPPGPVSIPPFERPAHPQSRNPVYYTFLPEGRYGSERRKGDTIEVTIEDIAVRHFDARTGAPIDGPDAAIPRAQWLAQQSALLEELRRSADPAVRDGDAGAAVRLGAFADRPGLAPSQRGVALGRSAVFWRRAGRLDRAMAQTEAALLAEPAIIGHRRRMIDLLVRAGRADEAVERSAGWLLNPSCADVVRDRRLAALFAADPSVGDRLHSPIDKAGTEGLPDWSRTVWDLHRARFNAAADFAASRNLEADPDLAFPAALAFALAGPSRRAEADRALRIVEQARGGGRVLPIVTLRAFLAIGSAAAGPSREAIEAELKDIGDSARENLADWYFETWAQALAARVFEARGDGAREGRLRESALRHPGAGEFLRFLTSKK